MAEKTFQVFDLKDLNQRRDESQRAYLEFLKLPTLSAGLYVLPAGQQDRQAPHTADELYYVLSGKAEIWVDEERRAVGPTSIIYVKAGVEHRFESIGEPLTVLVFFATKGRFVLRPPEMPDG